MSKNRGSHSYCERNRRHSVSRCIEQGEYLGLGVLLMLTY